MVGSAIALVYFLLSLVPTYSLSMSSSPSQQEDMIKPRILCLHGKFQSGAILSNKIAGARRKLARVYDLDFLDAPIVLPVESGGDNDAQQLAWWVRNEANENIKVQEALEYVLEHASEKQYHAILGFSQGGTLATALALSGHFPNIQAVVTAGSPFVPEAYNAALQILKKNGVCAEDSAAGQQIPKLHFAGENDTMVPVESTRQLCEAGGNGELIVHEKGHLFPTKAVHTNYMVQFLGQHVSASLAGSTML